MSNPLPWSENFAVGHDAVDRQHRRLVELINEIDAALDAAKVAARLPHLLKLFRLTVEEHFRQENALLWEIKMGGYAPSPDRPRTPRYLEAMAEARFDEHMAEHAKLLTRFDEMTREPPETLGETLKAWFVDHVVKQDSHLKTIFQAL